MRRYSFVVAALLAMVPLAHAQVSADEAQRRLAEHTAQHLKEAADASTRPSTPQETATMQKTIADQAKQIADLKVQLANAVVIEKAALTQLLIAFANEKTPISAKVVAKAKELGCPIPTDLQIEGVALAAPPADATHLTQGMSKADAEAAMKALGFRLASTSTLDDGGFMESWEMDSSDKITTVTNVYEGGVLDHNSKIEIMK